ncbi:hypothetical protein GCM10009529_12160 [Micropruina glycogenica]
MDPGGLTTAEIAGWTGHVLSGTRAELADVLRRPEARRNGAYLSTAGAIALGRSCNGRVEWTWDGGSYATWEDRGLDQDTG